MSKYTVERFLGGIGDVVLKDSLVAALYSGHQLSVKTLDFQQVPAVLILACYARTYLGAELVDDYEALIEAHKEATRPPGGLTAHPDLYLPSCICILHGRDQSPCWEAFQDVNVPELFDLMVRAEEGE